MSTIESNIAFAPAAEPKNTDLNKYKHQDRATESEKSKHHSFESGNRKNNKPLSSNAKQSIISMLQKRALPHQPQHQKFSALRTWKDTF